jgi:hypothetical protein
MDTMTKPTLWSTDRVRQAAHDTLQLELAMGSKTTEAMIAVIEGVIEAQSMEMLRNIRDWALAEAEDLDEVLEDDGVTTLCWFAQMLDDEIPMESRE